jgi:EmrB/QacA subfamily drug resistance transporter
MFAVSLAIISQEFHGRERGTAFGIWGATVGAAVAIGPLVGGALTTWAGWRWIFFVNLPIGVACIVGAARELHESRDEEHGGIDVPGLALISAGLFALVLGLLRGNDWHWGSGREIGLFVGGAAALVAFGVLQSRRTNPMLDVRLFRVPTFTGAQIIAFTISSAMFSQFLYLALYLQDVLRYSPVAAGVRFLPLSLASFVTAPIAGRLSERIPVRILFLVGMALVGGSLLLMHGITPSSHWTTLLAGFLVGGVGVGLVNAPLASTSVSVVEPRLAGRASGINNTFRQVGIATGIAGLGAIFQHEIASRLHGGAARAVASGVVRAPAERAAFISGLNEILLVAAYVAFAGAALGFLLVRRQDFVAGRPREQT